VGIDLDECRGVDFSALGVLGGMELGAPGWVWRTVWGLGGGDGGWDAWGDLAGCHGCGGRAEGGSRGGGGAGGMEDLFWMGWRGVGGGGGTLPVGGEHMQKVACVSISV